MAQLARGAGRLPAAVGPEPAGDHCGRPQAQGRQADGTPSYDPTPPPDFFRGFSGTPTASDPPARPFGASALTSSCARPVRTSSGTRSIVKTLTRCPYMPAGGKRPAGQHTIGRSLHVHPFRTGHVSPGHSRRVFPAMSWRLVTSAAQRRLVPQAAHQRAPAGAPGCATAHPCT
jgi:hypothetical protein